jgi:Mannosyl-glycoprotein endo-beta-N-acetylglucosaminidase
MGETMISRVGALCALPLATACAAVAFSVAAFAADLPEVKISDKNKVPECATPGRLTAFLEGRNAKFDGKFATIAADYMRVGEDIGIRWDTAFFQMMLETGNLTFTGDVSVAQNNFAGLGATGKHESGETFPDVATGVKAHLQHLLMYSGETVENPVAERTRKVQEWGVLTEWHKGIKGAVTYEMLARKWAPTSRHYVHDIETIADSFYDGLCKSADPKPEMMALVKPGKPSKTAKTIAAAKAPKVETPAVEAEVAEAPPAEAPPAQVASVADTPAPADAAVAKPNGVDLARKAVEEARASGSFVRSSLGGGSLFGLIGQKKPAADAAPSATAAAPVAAAVETPKAPVSVKILNAQKPEEDAASAAIPESIVKDAVTKDAAVKEPAAKVQVAALGSGMKAAAMPAPAAQAASSKCRVWTASYGGGRAIIIKASADQTTNYTVLDVNEGTEKREADAYISAYAKGGQTVGEFSNQVQALDKAFELCPEG